LSPKKQNIRKVRHQLKKNTLTSKSRKAWLEKKNGKGPLKPVGIIKFVQQPKKTKKKKKKKKKKPANVVREVVRKGRGAAQSKEGKIITLPLGELRWGPGEKKS